MRVTSVPAKRIFPRRGSIAPATPRSVVLLPAPLAPISATISPSATSKETSRQAGTSPYASSTFSTLSSKFAAQIGLDDARVCLHLARRAFEERHAMVHHEHALRDVHDEIQVVLHHEHRDAAVAELLQPLQQDLHLRGMQAR